MTVAVVVLAVAAFGCDGGGGGRGGAEASAWPPTGPGTFEVLLRSMVLQDADWTEDEAGRPRKVRLVVERQGRRLAEKELGGWRGERRFDDVSILVPFDGETATELRFEEAAPDGQSYSVSASWPFTGNQPVGERSLASWRWRPAPALPNK